jgi:amino acid adenylation domain-containing protein
MTMSTSDRAAAPLSFAQEQLWFLDQLTPGLTTYNILLAVRLHGPLDVDCLRRSLTVVVGRHEALRVTFAATDGVPFQMIAPPAEVELPVLDRTGLDEAGRQAAIEAAARELGSLPFDLSAGPLYRYRLVRLADDDHLLLENVHHIVVDGWSSGIINRELSLVYRALAAGAELDLLDPGPVYRNFARDQRTYLRDGTLEDELAFWAEKLADLPTLEMPTDRPRSATPNPRADSVIRTFPAELLGRARAVAAAHDVSLFTVLAAALNVVLSRYTGQRDVPIGVPMLGRPDPDLEEVVGLFVNMVVLRSDLTGDPSFATVLERVQDASFDLYEHQEVPFHLVVDRVQPVRTPGRNPLFQVSVQLMDGSRFGGQLDLPGITSEHVLLPASGSRFDMAIDFHESEDALRAAVEYSSDLFDAWRIEALLDHVATVVTAAAGNPGLRLSELPILTANERARLLAWGRGEPADYATEPLHVGLAAVAAATPDATAVVCRGARLSYAELDRQADRLARHLRRLGLTAGQIVAVVLDRDLDAYVAMVGILKAGAAFALMDPKLPAPRLDFMIRDTAAPVVVTRDVLVDRLPESSGWAKVSMDGDRARIDSAPADEPLAEWATRESLAYVLYTSGSTGTPKGVMIAHRAVSFFCEAYRRSFDFTSEDRLLQLPALNFDMSQGEIWTAFLVGATIVAVSPDDAQSPEALSALLRDERVTYAGLPPAMQSVMDAEPYPHLRAVMGGAEVLPPHLVNKWNLPGRRYLNLYGPTECAIGQTEYEVEHVVWRRPPPIGRPQLNRQVYVVDAADNLVPRGVDGELLIGGADGGLALGYLNQSELTAEKFVRDPFNPDSTVYRSGDLVHWNAAGQIEFVGRIDNQVKLRGLRIELGEIETALQSHPAVLRAAVLLRPDRTGENRLVAYFTAVGSAPTVEDLRGHLAESLPDYMVPTAWVPLDAFPMNNDGWKINRNALPDPVDERPGDRPAAILRTATEAAVADCFAEVLGMAEMDTEDRFFDIGGNSLQALRVVSRVNKRFGIRVSVRQLYGSATVGGFAAIVDERLRARSDAG